MLTTIPFEGADCEPLQGVLYICGTPIGNLKDASFRLIETLSQMDLILCEDTRRTAKLLAHYEIKKPLLSFHEHVEQKRTSQVIDELLQGKQIALVSDAGMPSISDPGAYLIQEARKNGIKLLSVPGPSAVTTALALSGYYASQFLFAGFPPRKPKKRQDYFAEWVKPGVPTVFFESPFRVVKFLGDLAKVLPGSQVCLCKEMTKVFEEVIEGPVQEVLEQIKDDVIKGEWVIVVYDRVLREKGAE